MFSGAANEAGYATVWPIASISQGRLNSYRGATSSQGVTFSQTDSRGATRSHERSYCLNTEGVTNTVHKAFSTYSLVS